MSHFARVLSSWLWATYNTLGHPATTAHCYYHFFRLIRIVIQIRHRAPSTVGVWCLVVLAHVQIPSLFRKSFRKTRVFLQETLTHRAQQNQQMPEMRSRAGGNPSQGCQSVRNPCYRLSPPGKVAPPPGTPQNHHFSVPLSPKAQGPLWAPWLDPWRATWSPHGAPKRQNGSQNAPKWTPKRVPKGPQNAKRRM